MEDLISIIVPIYNVEKYLKKCINSILNQTYKNIEVILIDDGSIDKCPQICNEYAIKDNRVKVIHKQNGGLSSARNAGLDIVKGKYISFIDSDDYIDINMIKRLYEVLKKDQSDLAICNMNYVYENKKTISSKYVLDNNLLNNYAIIEKLYENGSANYVVVCNKLYQKYLWDDIRFPIGEIHEDEAVIHKILLKCKKISTIKESLYFYLQREESIMHRHKTEKNMIKYEIFADRLNLLKKMLDNDHIKFGIIQYWFSFFKDYYYIENIDSNSKYLLRMKKSLIKMFPLMFKYRICSYKELFSIILFLINDKAYKKLFWKGQ